MPLENSPTLQDFEQGMPVQPPDREQITRARAKRRYWIAIALLIGAMIALSIINLQEKSAFVSLTQKGTVTGTVVDEDQAPLQAYVFVIGTGLEAITDAAGRFELRAVPAGQRSVVIAYLGAGREFPVIIQANTINDMGVIEFASTRVP